MIHLLKILTNCRHCFEVQFLVKTREHSHLKAWILLTLYMVHASSFLASGNFLEVHEISLTERGEGTVALTWLGSVYFCSSQEFYLRYSSNQANLHAFILHQVSCSLVHSDNIYNHVNFQPIHRSLAVWPSILNCSSVSSQLTCVNCELTEPQHVWVLFLCLQRNGGNVNLTYVHKVTTGPQHAIATHMVLIDW